MLKRSGIAAEEYSSMRSLIDTIRARACGLGRANRPLPRLRDESGVTIIEVLISALLMVTIAVTVFGALEASSRAGLQERNRARAFSLAQDDQVRLRAMQVNDLVDLAQTRAVTQDGAGYEIESRGELRFDRSASAPCDGSGVSADYVAISSEVTWANMGGRPPVVVESLVAPPNGSLSGDLGKLAVGVLDSRSQPLTGVSLTGTGAGSFSGSTGADGCAVFGNLPEGAYTVTPGISGMVDKDGLAPAPISTSVVGGGINTLGLQYDRPGEINTTFRTCRAAQCADTGSLPRFTSSSADSITVFNTGLTGARSFGTVGTPQATQTARPLFPFTSPYAVYAGSCTANNPGSGAALASVTVPVNGAASASIILPALNLTVYNGSKVAADYYDRPDLIGVPVGGVRVTITDRATSCRTKRTTTTNSAGKLADPGLPWSSYDVCVSGRDGYDGTVRRVTTTNVLVRSTGTARTLNAYLYDGQPGSCP